MGFLNASNFVKYTPLRIVSSTLFSEFGYPDKILSLVFNILHEHCFLQCYKKSRMIALFFQWMTRIEILWMLWKIYSKREIKKRCLTKLFSGERKETRLAWFLENSFTPTLPITCHCRQEIKFKTYRLILNNTLKVHRWSDDLSTFDNDSAFISEFLISKIWWSSIRYILVNFKLQYARAEIWCNWLFD